MSFRDRIKDFRRVPAGQLVPHPRNWREHPPEQQAALRGVLADIGYADAIVARELPDGTLEILDGHLRADLDKDQEIPVLVVDLNDLEATKFLVSHDPLAAMAEANEQALDALLTEIETETEAVQAMFDDLPKEHAGDGDAAGSASAPAAEPADDLRGVLVECASEADQIEVYNRMCKTGRRCILVTGDHVDRGADAAESTAERLLAAIEKYPGATINFLAERLGLARETVAVQCRKAIAARLVFVRGQGKHRAYYRPTAEKPETKRTKRRAATNDSRCPPRSRSRDSIS